MNTPEDIWSKNYWNLKLLKPKTAFSIGVPVALSIYVAEGTVIILHINKIKYEL